MYANLQHYRCRKAIDAQRYYYITNACRLYYSRPYSVLTIENPRILHHVLWLSQRNNLLLLLRHRARI
jgi:hypothetical protein